MTHQNVSIIMILFLLCTGLTLMGEAQPVRPERMYAGSYALIIGVSEYREWPSLSGVRDDVQQVEAALEQMGFQVEVKMGLQDRNALEKGFKDFINAHGGNPANRLLFYFAGHGETIRRSCDDELGMGYIVAADAPLPRKEVCPSRYTPSGGLPRKRLIDARGFFDYALNMEAIKVYAYDIPAKHALFVFDSCFSGTIFTTRDSLEGISYLTKEPVRQFITSGSAGEKVPDYSIFRREFITALLDGKGDFDQDGYVTAGELGWYLEKNVVNQSQGSQHPQYGKINHPSFQKGNFVFTLPNRPTPTPRIDVPQEGEFALDDLEIRAQWRQYQQRVEEAYAQVQAYEQQAGDARDKQEAWRRFVEYAQQDNPYSERDNELRSLAEERLRYWQNYHEPPPKPTARYQLRKEPGTYSDDDIKQMLKSKGFFDNRDNPDGDCPNEYESKTLNGDTVVIDHATGLMWQQGGSSESMVWSEAQGYVDQLNRSRYAGFSDWRLPTIEELASLIEATKKNGDLYIDAKFDNNQLWCWSSDKRSSSAAWHVSFYNGHVYGVSMAYSRYVRAVRSRQLITWSFESFDDFWGVQRGLPLCRKNFPFNVC